MGLAGGWEKGCRASLAWHDWYPEAMAGEPEAEGCEGVCECVFVSV